VTKTVKVSVAENWPSDAVTLTVDVPLWFGRNTNRSSVPWIVAWSRDGFVLPVTVSVSTVLSGSSNTPGNNSMNRFGASSSTSTRPIGLATRGGSFTAVTMIGVEAVTTFGPPVPVWPRSSAVTVSVSLPK
jgi:hypothetical protein